MGIAPTRMGNEFGFAVPCNVFDCTDGQVMMGVLLDSHWKILARTIGYPELAEDPSFTTLRGRAERRDACNAMVTAWMAERTREEAIEAFSRGGIPIAPVNTYGDAARDPHVAEREMLQPTRLEDGAMAPITAPAAKFSRTPTKVRTGAPALGQHNEDILSEIGIDKAAREKLERAGIVQTPTRDGPAKLSAAD